MALFFVVGYRCYLSRDCIANGAFGCFSMAPKYLGQDNDGGGINFTYGDLAVIVRVRERVVGKLHLAIQEFRFR